MFGNFFPMMLVEVEYFFNIFFDFLQALAYGRGSVNQHQLPRREKEDSWIQRATINKEEWVTREGEDIFDSHEAR